MKVEKSISAQKRAPRPRAAIRIKKGPRVPKKWLWHYEALQKLRERLLADRGDAVLEAVQPIEMHSLHQADSASDEFDHDLALCQLSAEADAIREIDSAILRILEGKYGICEVSGKPIPLARLRAVPWTRFRREVQSERERASGLRTHLGELGTVRRGAEPELASGAQDTFDSAGSQGGPADLDAAV